MTKRPPQHVVGLPTVDPRQPEAKQAPAALMHAADTGLLYYRTMIDTTDPDDIAVVREENGAHAWVPNDGLIYYLTYIPGEGGQQPALILEQDVVAFVTGLQALMAAQSMELLTYGRYVNAADTDTVNAVRTQVFGKRNIRKELPTTGGFHLLHLDAAKVPHTVLIEQAKAAEFALGLAFGNGHPGAGKLAASPWTVLR